MDKNFSNKCWNCSGTNMEPVKTYFKCRDCGATWNAVVKVGPEELERGLGGGDFYDGSLGGKAGRPSPALLRRAAAARAQAKQSAAPE